MRNLIQYKGIFRVTKSGPIALWLLFVYVAQSDKKGLIAGKYMCSLNYVYLKFSIRYYGSVTFIKLSINFYISGKSFKLLSYLHKKL